MAPQLYKLDLIVDTSHIEAGTEVQIEYQAEFTAEEVAGIDFVLDVIEVRAPKLIQRHWMEA